MLEAPPFPKFRKVTLDDRGWYNEFYRHFEPYADFSFGNLVIWLDQSDDLEISQLNDNLVLKCTTLFMDNKLMLTFLGKHKLTETIQALFDYQAERGLEQELLGIPGTIIESLGHEISHLVVAIDDRDNYEYILDVRSLATLEGSGLRKIRREVSVFLRNHGDEVLIKELDLTKDENREFLRNELLSWEKAFSTNETAHQEEQVIMRTLDYADKLNYGNLSLFVDDKLAGIILYQRVPQADFVIVNHIKSSYEYRYVFDFMFYACANKLLPQGIKYINFEQDLGLAGLREHKEA